MLLSFILNTTAIESEVLNDWLTNIFQQKSSDFEVVVIDDGVNNENLEVMSKFFKLYSEQLVLITYFQNSGISIGRNLGLKYARGEYVIVLNPSEIPNVDFVSFITQILEKNPKIDCIEYRVHYELDANSVFHSTIRIETNEVYQLNTFMGKSVYALTSPILSTKVMKLSIIREHGIQFRKEIQFDSLFLYSFLAHCTEYYAIIDTLITCKFNSCRFNSLEHDNTFDLLNQWVHILNYYNNQKIKKVLHDELEYAFVRYYLYTFLRFISITKKPLLIQKAYNRVKDTIDFRYKNFLKNPYLKTINKYDVFTTYCLNLSKYIKTYCRENKIVDDSKYWE
ncbi:glycosyltransferase family A protein [Spiroplasma endosymbiont of Virgichneumon dumeticola]|uniref:glycosyltransferase family A protein n=1 Tax=Spiroplasma endosymbiont of Virgichneumon dumeticola TaxID=3139323 RepID=UPI0035C925B5